MVNLNFVAPQIRAKLHATCWACRRRSLNTLFIDSISLKINSARTLFMIVQMTGLSLPTGLFSTWLNTASSLRWLRFTFSCLVPGVSSKVLLWSYRVPSPLSPNSSLSVLVTPSIHTGPCAPLKQENIFYQVIQDYLIRWIKKHTSKVAKMFSPSKPWKNIKKGIHLKGLPCWLIGKESTCQCRRCEFDLWVGRRCEFDLWVRKISWRRKWQPTPVFLFGKSHGRRSLVGYSTWGHQELDTAEWLNNNNNAFKDTLHGYGLTFMLLNVFICCGVSHHKIPHTGWLETAGTYFLTNLETQVQDQSVGRFGFSKPLSLVCRWLSSHSVLTGSSLCVHPWCLFTLDLYYLT